MRRALFVVLLLPFLFPLLASQPPAPPRPWVSSLQNPSALAVGANGQIFVAVVNDLHRSGTAAILRIEGDRPVPFAVGLDRPRAMAFHAGHLYVADRKRIVKVDGSGKIDSFLPALGLPVSTPHLDALTIDPESGTVYAAGAGGIYRITPKGMVVPVVELTETSPLREPKALLLDGQSHLLVAANGTKQLHRLKLADGTTEKIADNLAINGLAWDYFGRLFLSSTAQRGVYVISRPGDKPVLVAGQLGKIGALCLNADRSKLVVADPEQGTLLQLPNKVPGQELIEKPIALEPRVAFKDVKWAGWQPESASGKLVPLRPVVLTHAGDGSNRVFVGTQHGVVHVLPDDQAAKESQVFLDIQDRVTYHDATNEEGFLGLAFHPKFKANGEFFVFYTPKKPKNSNVLSRFRLRKDDPTKADPASEEILLRFTKPYWNHDGGTIVFGPDGYLYLTHGDGGLANDPYDNGQKLGSLLGKILRIDVDRKDPGLEYAIPKDNPFVGKEGVRPEIWAYGLRNVWRMAFDRETGDLWAADVGQNLYEEINIITKGGNYGWNRREGLHPFSKKGVGPRPDLIDPVWEYHHDLGKSITGGGVYRGKRLPEIEGRYLYADYVSGRIWALRYDSATFRTVANHPLKDHGMPIHSFGEDEKGEMYLLTASPTGQGIYRLERTK